MRDERLEIAVIKQNYQHHQPHHRPKWHNDHESGVFGLVMECHDAHPAPDAAAQSSHPKQRPFGDSELFLFGFLFVDAIKDKSQNIDYQEVTTDNKRYLRHDDDKTILGGKNKKKETICSL